MQHESMMHRCLELAALGIGHVAPNPMVGSVLTHQGRIIGEGWHRKFGTAHAEVNAFENAGQLPSSELTLYVNLEPCSHHGKTPPCVERILKEGVQQVVIGTKDPNPLVGGNGIMKLREAGVEVVMDVLKKECRTLNKRFFMFHEKQRPYIILKWAQSADGLIDKHPRSSRGSYRISGPEATDLVHRWRSEEAAILVGSRTALHDDPALTVRCVGGKDPLRVLIDRKGIVPASSKFFDGSAPTLVLGKCMANKDGIQLIPVGVESDPLDLLLATLVERNITSLLVEGGAELLGQFIARDIWDEARVILGSMLLGNGTVAPIIPAQHAESYRIGNDTIAIHQNPNAR